MKYCSFWQGGCHKASSLFLFLFVLLAAFDTFSEEIIHHDLHVRLRPAEAGIVVSDVIHLPPGTKSAEFSLRSSLSVKADGVELIVLDESATGRFRHYRINRLPADGKVRLDYQGKIVTEGTKGPFDMPESLLSTEYVYLDGDSAWLANFRNWPLFTFTLQVAAPPDWEVISQGRRDTVDLADSGTVGYRFNMSHPQDVVYLLGGPYRRYATMHEGVEIAVYLFEDDAALANAYLQASAGALSLYGDWIGRYPYAKFAVVENRWETGYGMPSFTLLGPTVIRLPFILNTSLPHEVLHNWWGNGVYVDYTGGNWSEGLTAYMSDHFLADQRGRGREYRRKSLERYNNFAAKQGDFALTDFRARHDEASQAVGYCKSLMIFHMLRTLVGAEGFDEGIRQFWQRYRFSYAGFPDLVGLLYPDENTDDFNASEFIQQWVTTTGAPEITLGEVTVSKRGEGYLLSVNIAQQQQGPAYRMQIPFEIKFSGESQVLRDSILLENKNQLFTFKLKQPPQSFTLDPDYDVFRLLNAGEQPSSLGRLFGAKQQLLVIPASAGEEQIMAWQQLAAAWAGQYNNVALVYDSQIENKIINANDHTAIWLLGWNNKLLPEYRDNFTAHNRNAATHEVSQKLSANAVTIENRQLHADKHAVVLLDADNTRRPLGFIGANDPQAIASVARKLPHYSSYGRLAFELPEMNNIIKEYLPVLNSPMEWKAGQD